MGDFILKYWVGIGFGLIVSGIGGLCQHYRCKMEQLQIKHHATELGVRALLRDKIIVIYHKYIDKGEIPLYELESLEDLFKQYENLGGNGTIKKLVSRIQELDVKEL